MLTDEHPFLARLQQATNAHDLQGVVDCLTNGTQHRLRGEQAQSARFYLEPVDEGHLTADDAVRIQTRSGGPA